MLFNRSQKGLRTLFPSAIYELMGPDERINPAVGGIRCSIQVVRHTKSLSGCFSVQFWISSTNNF